MNLITRVWETQWAHKYVWPTLHALYEAGLASEPHKFWPGDWVYVKRFGWDELDWDSHLRNATLMPDQLIHSLQRKITGMGSAAGMESSGYQSSQVKINSVLCLLILLTVCTAAPNPHNPFDLTWVTENSETGYYAQLSCTRDPLGTHWFPDLTFDLSWVADNSWPDTQWTLWHSYPLDIDREAFIYDPGRKALSHVGVQNNFALPLEGVKHHKEQ